MKRVGCYVRVSTQEQKNHGLSIDSQIKALQEYCSGHGYSIAAIYNDAGISASKRYTRRPALLQMIQDCKDGKVDLVVFTKLDRFFRSVPDYYECISKMNGVPWRAIWEDYETETSSGIFKVNIMLSIAQAESDRTSERIKAVNEYRRASGAYVGSAPLGYKLHKSGLSIDPDAAEAVKAFFSTFADTMSIDRSVYAARDKGIAISRDRARKMLTSKTYCGDAYGYKCEPYISEDQYAVNSSVIAGRRHRATKAGRVYIFSGLLRCGDCGKKYQGTYNKVPHGGKIYSSLAYKCSGAHDLHICDRRGYVFERKLEKILIDQVDNIVAEYEYHAEVSSAAEDYVAKRSALEARLTRIGVRFEDGDISTEEYRAKRDALKAEIAQLEKPKQKNIPQLPNNWKDVYNSLTRQNQKDFWASIIDAIYILKDGRQYKVTISFL